jgi:hypothetical protein
MAKKMTKTIMKTVPRVRANSGPTVDSFLQKGHLANWLLRVLKRNESSQWPQVTLHIPGVDAGRGLGPLLDRDASPPPRVSLVSERLMTLLQFCLGQAILRAEALQMRRQLHGHRTYFFPFGASLMGVASLQLSHLTTCCSFLLEMSMRELQTLQATSVPDAEVAATEV